MNRAVRIRGTYRKHRRRERPLASWLCFSNRRHVRGIRPLNRPNEFGPELYQAFEDKTVWVEIGARSSNAVRGVSW